MEVLEIKEDMLPNYFKDVNMRKNLQRNHNLDPEKATCTKFNKVNGNVL